LDKFQPRRPDDLDFAVGMRVVLLNASNGVPLDISLGAMPFEERIIARATNHTFSSDVELLTCSAEDLVVLKAFANRTKDWWSHRTSGGTLDVSLILRELGPLIELKEEPEIRRHLKQLLGRV
jgi:hypothetical protein